MKEAGTSVIEIITTIESRKRAENRHPTAVTLTELRKVYPGDFEAELAALIDAGIVSLGDTINDKYIRISAPGK